MPVYLDTNIIVSYVNPRDSLHAEARRLVEETRRLGHIVSPLVETELFSVYSRTTGLEGEELEALVLYSLEEVGARVLRPSCYRLHLEANRLAPLLRLRTLDLLHVAAAHLLDADMFASFDTEIRKKSRLIEEATGVRVLPPLPARGST